MVPARISGSIILGLFMVLYFRQLNSLPCCPTPGRLNCKLPHIVHYMVTVWTEKNLISPPVATLSLNSPLLPYTLWVWLSSFLCIPWTFCYCLFIPPLSFMIIKPSHLSPCNNWKGDRKLLHIESLFSGLFLYFKTEREVKENIIHHSHKQKATGHMLEAV